MKNKNAARLGKLGGKSTSDAKRQAAKSNGKLGGRPRKIRPDDDQRQPGKDGGLEFGELGLNFVFHVVRRC